MLNLNTVYAYCFYCSLGLHGGTAISNDLRPGTALCTLFLAQSCSEIRLFWSEPCIPLCSSSQHFERPLTQWGSEILRANIEWELVDVRGIPKLERKCQCLKKPAVCRLMWDCRCSVANCIPLSCPLMLYPDTPLFGLVFIYSIVQDHRVPGTSHGISSSHIGCMSKDSVIWPEKIKVHRLKISKYINK